MNRKNIITLMIIVFSLGGVLLISLCFSRQKTAIPEDARMTIQFRNQGQTETHLLSRSEAEQIASILTNRDEHHEQYSCGFSANLAIIVDDTAFYIASDSCPILYDTSTSMFFKVSRKDKQIIASIFSRYGGIVYW